MQDLHERYFKQTLASLYRKEQHFLLRARSWWVFAHLYGWSSVWSTLTSSMRYSFKLINTKDESFTIYTTCQVMSVHWFCCHWTFVANNKLISCKFCARDSGFEWKWKLKNSNITIYESQNMYLTFKKSTNDHAVSKNLVNGGKKHIDKWSGKNTK